MIATQPKQADFDQRTPILAVGVDNGHGLLKAAIDADSRQMKVRCPSKFKAVREDLLDYPTSKYGSTFYYRDGDAKTLKGNEWKTGELAYTADPHGHTKLSDKAEYKIEYALHSILGALGTLPYRRSWNLYIVASIHNSKLFAHQLTEALEGIHVVNFNGKSSQESIIKIKVGLIAPEGSGSYVYCRHQNLIDHTKHALALDFGRARSLLLCSLQAVRLSTVKSWGLVVALTCWMRSPACEKYSFTKAENLAMLN
jgi:hypothetical protein